MNTIIARSRFPQAAAAAVAAVIAIGFARTFYLKFLFNLPPLTRAALLHGIFATLWLALHFTQARLISKRRVALHKRLGIFTACVGFVLAAQAINLAIVGVAAGRAPPGRDPLQFLSVPVGTTFMFVLFLGTALALRKRREWHSRLMLLATMALLVPAMGRFDTLLMPLGWPRGLLAMIVTAAFVTWAWAHDWRKLGRVHPAFITGGIALLLSLPARRALGFTDFWHPIAQWLIS